MGSHRGACGWGPLRGDAAQCWNVRSRRLEVLQGDGVLAYINASDEAELIM